MGQMQPADSALTAYADRLVRASNPAEEQAILAEKDAPLSVGLSELMAKRGDEQQQRLRNLPEALRFYQLAVTIAEWVGNKRARSRAMFGMGIVYSGDGRFDRALESMQQTARFAESQNDTKALASAYNSMAIYVASGKHELALQFLDRSMKLNQGRDRRMHADALINYGAVLMAQGHDAEALRKLEEGLEINDEIRNNRSIVEALQRIAEIRMRSNEYELALAASSRGVEIADYTRALPQQSEMYDVIGRVYQGLNRWEEAENAFHKSIVAVEELQELVAGDAEQQEAFLEKRNQPYKNMVGLLVARKRPDEAFQFAEREKARVLLNMMQRDRVQVSKELTDAEREGERNLQSQIAWVNTELSRLNPPSDATAGRARELKVRLDQARLQLSAFQTSLYAAHPVLQTQRSSTPAISLPETRDLLSDDETVLLEYAVNEARTFLFAIRSRNGKPELNAFTIEIGREELSKRVLSFQDKIATRDLDYRGASVALYKLLLEPAKAQLAGAKTIVIVPDQSLWQLPFHALSNSAQRYMIEDHAIFLSPSLTFLREIQRRGSSVTRTPRLFAMADPGKGAAGLANADREARVLADVYGKTSSKVYTQSAAREHTAKTETADFDVVHFATHGVFDDKHPMYSHLVLASSGDDPLDDGLLEAREMMSMNLKAAVVVLSACETARGRVGGGEGLIGMMWALFIAGSPTTVASQWKVDSAGTSDLMIRFHQKLRIHLTDASSVQSKAMALQSAALSVMRKPEYRHPFYWAGFVMVGNGF